MSINKTYAVFGLGRYGRAVARELAENGAEVLAIDMDEDIVNAASVSIPFCKCADFTDAVFKAANAAVHDDVVLMSPASAAFDQFKNFMERGKYFKKLVMEL